jgi:hypothetical protein
MSPCSAAAHLKGDVSFSFTNYTVLVTCTDNKGQALATLDLSFEQALVLAGAFMEKFENYGPAEDLLNSGRAVARCMTPKGGIGIVDDTETIQ